MAKQSNGTYALRYLCRECEKKYWDEYREKKREEKRMVLDPDVEIRFQRRFKEIDPELILNIEKSGIILLGLDEIFVPLRDYNNTFFSNYGRCIVVSNNGDFVLQPMHKEQHGESFYNLYKSVWLEGECCFIQKKVMVYVAKTVCQLFVVNHDSANNRWIWHAGYDKEDFYYRNLYPLSEQQYYAVRRWFKQGNLDTEEAIVNIMNDPMYFESGYRLRNLRQTICGIGYSGCEDADVLSMSHHRWRGMIHRCLNHEDYVDVEVCQEWLNYSNFRIWWDSHYYQIPGEQMDLDKDLFSGEKKLYSPETCCFLPHSVNVSLAMIGKSSNGLPGGVWRDNNRDSYGYQYFDIEAEKWKKKRRKNLDDAIEGYYEGRRNYTEYVKQKYKDRLPHNVMSALLKALSETGR